MTPVGPPRTPPRGHRRPATNRPAAPRRGGAARGARPAGRAYDRPRPSRPAPRRLGRPGRPRVRLVGTLVLLVLAFGAIVVRLVQVQALSGEEYAAFGASQRFQDITLPADRGSIFDRNGNDLAVSLPQQTIWANPSLIAHPLEVATALAPALALDPAGTTALAEKLAGDTEFTYVARRVADDIAANVEELDLPGIAFLEEPKRFAPAGDLARSVLGEVGVDNDGLFGLEKQYDDALTGEPGALVIEKDPDGRTIPGGEHERRPAAARRRPRAHDRPLDAVRDGAGPGRPDPRQGRQGWDGDRVPPRRRARSSPWPTSPRTPRPARSWRPATTWAPPRCTNRARSTR